MAMQGITNTAQSLSYYRRAEELMAHNLANTETQGFKAIRVSASTGAANDGIAPVQWTDWRQGALSETGRPLDIALEGPGFLVVQTEQGERLTRGGPLQLDAAGRITDLEGHPMLGIEGPIVVTGGSVDVEEDGTVRVDGSGAGQLRIESVSDLAALQRDEGGRYVPAGPTAPVAPGATWVRQGRLEEPNLDAILAMVDLIGVHRAYAANLNVLKVMDSVLGIGVNEIAKV
jgi:flagellar basal body rod protein FlgG